MHFAIIAFALGIWLQQQAPSLLPLSWLVLAALPAAAVQFLGVRRGSSGGYWRRASWLMLALLAGVAWTGVRAEWRLADSLPAALEGRDVTVHGIVDGLPQTLPNGVRFVFRVDAGEAVVPRRIQLSWYGGAELPALRPGQRWTLTVRLRRPHGFSNPHGFDYEAWLLERGVRATGYVRRGDNRLLGEGEGGMLARVHGWRHDIRARFAHTLGEAPYAGMLIALAVGDQRAIPRAQWEVFRRVGVNHLVAISGLHVSLVALFAGGLVAALWRRLPTLALRLATPRAAALAALLAAFAYALLAGMGVPVQRALCMLAVVALALLGGWQLRPAVVLALALLVVLVIDPWAVLGAGFWLSFGAVAVILMVLSGRTGVLSGWRAALRVQLAITVALVPALLVLFQAFSLVSPLANALAIPLVSFAIAPLALVAAVLPVEALLHLAHALTAVMMMALEWLAGLPFAFHRQAAPPPWLTAAALAGVAWLLLPRGTPARLAGVLALLPLLWWAPPRPPPGAFVATVLDVGQGQAIHVQTATHDLLLDAGPPYGEGADAGERVVLPYFNAIGVRALDRLLISHGDADHAGGVASVLEEMPVAGLLGSLLPGHPLAAHPAVAFTHCSSGQRWQWDGVSFAVLHPDMERPRMRRENDNSCVLQVAAGGMALLVSSDIERAAEREMLAREGEALRSTVVVAPHHGSRSSSLPALVDAIGAQAVIYSVGYRNSFGHPHPEVQARWQAAGARDWRTDRDGALRLRMDAGGWQIEAQRSVRRRYWHGR